MIRRSALAAAAAVSCIAATAADPLERLPDPEEEARARALFKTLRCVVCQNESIDESDAELAGDLRRIVRRQVASGRSDAQIEDFLVERYGDFILLKPPFTPGNALLWLTPVLVIGAGGAYLLWSARKPKSEPEVLSIEEAEALKALTGDPTVTLPPHRGRNNTLGPM